jgi:hypothetical protein
MYCDSTIRTDVFAPGRQRDAPLPASALSAAARGVMQVVLAVVQESAAGAARMSPDADRRAGWQELGNKLEAFRAFEHADALLGVPMSIGVEELLARAEALPLPLGVWVAEGVGYHVTVAACAGGQWPPRACEIPDWAAIPWSAGMGAALAAAVLDPLLDASTVRVEQAISDFESACRDSIGPDHLGVALEAFGFAVRSMYAELMTAIAATLDSVRPAFAPFFWHGAGRAMYFAPTASFPVSTGSRQAMDEVLLTTPPGRRANAMAGCAWAATLVNLGHPPVLERLMLAIVERPQWIDACRLGIQSALEVWRRCAPGDPALREVLTHQPDDVCAREAWNDVLSAALKRPAVRVAGELFALEIRAHEAPR